MRVLALIVAAVGCLLVGIGGFGLHTTFSAWDILGQSGALMGLQPDHWRGHWVGTTVAYITLGIVFFSFAVGLWRRSRRAAFAWSITISGVAVLWLLLFLLHPLPYGFQQIGWGEVAFFFALSVASWLLVHTRHNATTI